MPVLPRCHVGTRGVGKALGLVVGTIPATPLQFSVGLAPGQYAQLDDVVVTRRALPGQGQVQISGVVTNVEAMHEGAHKDPCAPQNLVHIGGLERQLRHRLGDQQLLYRALREAARRAAK